jgi:hypothetical protein
MRNAAQFCTFCTIGAFLVGQAVSPADGNCPAQESSYTEGANRIISGRPQHDDREQPLGEVLRNF